MTDQSNRVRQLNQAKDVIVDLEAELDAEMGQARDRLGTASSWIGNDGRYHDHLQKAMGQVAGEAIRYGYDEIAVAAAEIVESAEADDQ
jgi:hypothetical protein